MYICIFKETNKTQVGHELNLAYVSPSLPLPERVGSLWKTWGFVCTCRRCKSSVREMVVPPFHTPKWSCLVGKPIVVG